MRTHKDLDVWKKSVSMVSDIYSLTKCFPKEEVYGLTSQIRRSAVSVPSNIAEGAARKTNKEYILFLYYAKGSLSELETQLIIARNLEYINNDLMEKLDNDICSVSKMLSGLVKSVKNRVGMSNE